MMHSLVWACVIVASVFDVLLTLFALRFACACALEVQWRCGAYGLNACSSICMYHCHPTSCHGFSSFAFIIVTLLYEVNAYRICMFDCHAMSCHGFNACQRPTCACVPVTRLHALSLIHARCQHTQVSLTHIMPWPQCMVLYASYAAAVVIVTICQVPGVITHLQTSIILSSYLPSTAV